MKNIKFVVKVNRTVPVLPNMFSALIRRPSI